MAKTSKKDSESEAKKPRSRKQLTVRERSETGSTESRRARVRRKAGAVKSPIQKASSFGKKEYHMPLPGNRAGNILGKRVRLVPKFVREAWQEIRLVTWPNRQETWRLTIAVFIFAVVFAAIVGVLDYGLDKLFREVILD